MQQHRRRPRRGRVLRLSMLTAACVLVLAGCGTLLEGRAVSALYNPNRVGGLDATGGPSGVRGNAPQPTGTVKNTDNGDIDKLTLLAINDIEEFWAAHYSESLDGSFKPVSSLLSYDSKDPASPMECGRKTYKLVNAFYCPPRDVMAWDRGVLVPGAAKYFGDASVASLLAHEYGHALQNMAGLVDKSTPTIVKEQQADCFSGVYTRWVAEGQSRRFELNTTDGLDHVLAGVIDIRDPVLTPEDTDLIKNGHGTAVDRVGAFQIGFDSGASACAAIDFDEITQRRGNLPLSLQVDTEGNLNSGEVKLDDDTVSTLVEVLGKIFNPAKPPTLTTQGATCPNGAQTDKPASYCPAGNTINVDLPALQNLGKPADEADEMLVQGDNTAISVITSRYVQALQQERGVAIDSPASALRTACLTGFAQRSMAEPVDLPSGKTLILTAGDVDEAVAGLLTNGFVASDANGATVPSGFTRILAYRSGLLGDVEQCYQRFP